MYTLKKNMATLNTRECRSALSGIPRTLGRPSVAARFKCRLRCALLRRCSKLSQWKTRFRLKLLEATAFNLRFCSSKRLTKSLSSKCAEEFQGVPVATRHVGSSYLGVQFLSGAYFSFIPSISLVETSYRFRSM